MALDNLKVVNNSVNVARATGQHKNVLLVRSYQFNKLVDQVSTNKDNIDDMTTVSTVTQATSISTGVTINAKVGVITTVSSTLAAGSNAAFTVTNSEVTAASNIQLTVEHPGAGIPVVVLDATPGAGSFVVRIYNVHGANAFNNTLKVHFRVS